MSSLTLEDLIVNGLNSEYSRKSTTTTITPVRLPEGTTATLGAVKRASTSTSTPSSATSPASNGRSDETSPGDSDYESAQETGCAPSKVAKTSDTSSGQTLDERIQDTIKNFFRKSEPVAN